jgi:hypothetical protein
MQTVKKPDFICIGPTKTGTTWLYEMLRHHPQVWLPPLKELRFFNEGNVVPAHSLQNVLFSRHWHYAMMRQRLLKNIKSMTSRKRIAYKKYAEPWWFYRYCFGRRSFEWYSSLFLPDENRLAGDISPPYYEIPEPRIREVSNFNPKIKILIFIRNPVERVWSLALMALCRDKGRSLAEVTPAEFIKFFDYVFNTSRSYLDSIKLWSAYFPDVFVGYYDALKENPSRFFQDICEFLGIKGDRVAPSLLCQHVNRGMNMALPFDFAEYLRSQYYDEIMSLAQEHGSRYPNIWFENRCSEKQGVNPG